MIGTNLGWFHVRWLGFQGIAETFLHAESLQEFFCELEIHIVI